MKQKATPSVRFVLKNKNAKNRTAIYMIYAWGYRGINKKGNEAYIPLKYSTHQSVHPGDWENQRAKGEYSGKINAELDEIKNKADKIYNKLYDEGLTPSLFRDELDMALGRKTEPKRKVVTISQYMDRFLSDVETGRRKTFKDPTKNFEPGSVRVYRSFKHKIEEYSPDVTFEQINMSFYKGFMAFLNERHGVNTAGRYIKNLKTIMQAALDDDVHSNIEFKKKGFRSVSELVDTIYLNDEEIDMLYNHRGLPKSYDKARDIWMVCALTLQRISDYEKIIDPDNLKQTRDGTRVIQFRQQKTKTQVTIPFTSARLRGIFDKYGHDMPVMSPQRVNRYIKEVCEAAGIVPEKASEVTTHTARRSGCTNWYNNGIPIGRIMKVSGHKTESEFRKYIRLTDEENAEDLAKNEYINR